MQECTYDEEINAYKVFIDEIISYQQAAPEVLIGTISVASIATLYVAISYILYYDSLLPYLIAGGVDFAIPRYGGTTPNLNHADAHQSSLARNVSYSSEDARRL